MIDFTGMETFAKEPKLCKVFARADVPPQSVATK